MKIQYETPKSEVNEFDVVEVFTESTKDGGVENGNTNQEI